MPLDTSSLLLTVADNLNATATVSVTGAGAGGSVAVYRAPWTYTAGARMDWSLAATATADGSGNASANVSAPVGFYAWQAVRLATADTVDRLTGVVFRPLIDVADPVHKRVLDAVVGGIRTLNLDGIGSDPLKVFARWYPSYQIGYDDVSPTGAGLPQIQVAPYPREVPLGSLTGRDDVGYPVMVTFFDKSLPTMDTNLSRDLKWRRQVSALFRYQQLVGVPEIVITQWQPDSIVLPDGLKQNYAVGGVLFQFTSRETRGLVT